jgi:1,4-dihydroxy-2-naphthoate octaprenyltransferase
VLVLLPLASIPAMIPLVRTVSQDGDPRQLNLVLAGTARLSLAFCVLFALGLALEQLVRWP